MLRDKQQRLSSVRKFWARLICSSGIIVTFLPLAAQAAKTNFVLVVDQEAAGRPAHFEFLSGLRQALEGILPGRSELQIENLDPLRAEDATYYPQFEQWLTGKYRGRKPDAIVALGPMSLEFMFKARGSLFPQTPIVFSAVEKDEARAFAGRTNLTGVPVGVDMAGTLEAAVELCPEARRIALISDEPTAPQVHQRLLAEVARVAATGFEFIPLTNLGLAEAKHRLATLPPQTIVLFHSIRIEGGYQVFTQRDALAELSSVSRSPLFSCADIFIGFGTVGGSSIVYSRLGAEVAGQVGAVIRAGNAESVLAVESACHRLMFDWREMQRWSIAESRVPPGSDVRFRLPTLWEAHREKVVIVISALIIQAALIIALLVQRFRRQQAERALLQNREQLAHAGRVSAMGQLASSLAHELNQPLGAILRNAEAAELYLQKAVPNLDEVRAVLADIRKDDQRAGGVIDRMRALLQRHQLTSERLALPELAKDVIALVQVDAALRHVDCDLQITPGIPAIRGDRVHLQQVLLNLLLNAMDAMSQTRSEARRLLVRIRPASAQNVEVMVADSGAGIPVEHLAQVFTPFFTTKASGMGMGLSIARTIIEAHGGRIWAENRPEGGAAFRFMLPADEQV